MHFNIVRLDHWNALDEDLLVTELYMMEPLQLGAVFSKIAPELDDDYIHSNTGVGGLTGWGILARNWVIETFEQMRKAAETPAEEWVALTFQDRTIGGVLYRCAFGDFACVVALLTQLRKLPEVS